MLPQKLQLRLPLLLNHLWQSWRQRPKRPRMRRWQVLLLLRLLLPLLLRSSQMEKLLLPQLRMPLPHQRRSLRRPQLLLLLLPMMQLLLLLRLQ